MSTLHANIDNTLFTKKDNFLVKTKKITRKSKITLHICRICLMSHLIEHSWILRSASAQSVKIYSFGLKHTKKIQSHTDMQMDKGDVSSLFILCIFTFDIMPKAQSEVAPKG